ncbi:hypothetical protein E2C01_000790 [Portunus trituberculatus]|uniref:Uncharacterized protein n=1 Tax=Portunus trituberculatus TaxID=210409 RepID=A0A5B7CKW6_PORTR|nr:hypothetical protein [Portunus trituberculatus]
MRNPEPDRQPSLLPGLLAASMETVVISHDAVRRNLKNLMSRKLYVLTVCPHLLKNYTNELTTPLVNIFHQCLVSRVWPSPWKEARVTPMHKKERSELKTTAYLSPFGCHGMFLVAFVCLLCVGAAFSLYVPADRQRQHYSLDLISRVSVRLSVCSSSSFSSSSSSSFSSSSPPLHHTPINHSIIPCPRKRLRAAQPALSPCPLARLAPCSLAPLPAAPGGSNEVQVSQVSKSVREVSIGRLN